MSHRSAPPPRPVQLLRALAAASVVAAASTAAPLNAAPLTDVSGIGGVFDKVLLVQPIITCRPGSLCSSPDPLHPSETIQALAQARIATGFLPANSVTSKEHHTYYIPYYDSILGQPGYGQSSNVQTVNVWVSQLILQNDDPSRIYGFALAPDVQGSTTQNAVFLNQSLLARNYQPYTLAHELGHTLGLVEHDDQPGRLLNTYAQSPTDRDLTAIDIAILRTSGFLVDVPQIRLSTRIVGEEGSFATEVRIEHLATPGAADVALREMKIDLVDLLGSQGPPGQLPATHSAGVGIVGSSLSQRIALSYTENMITSWPCRTCEGEEPGTSSSGGLPEVGIDFGDAGLAPGDWITLRFGISTNLRNEYEYTESRSFGGALVDLHFAHGLSAQTLLADPMPAEPDTASQMTRFALAGSADDTQVFDLRRFTGIYDEGLYHSPFGAQYGPGESAANNGRVIVDETRPGSTGRVPLPSTAALLLAALMAPAVRRVALRAAP